MHHLDKAKALRQVRRSCTSAGIDFVSVPALGKGSHQGIVFKDLETGASVKLVFSGGREISPGVQRRILKRLDEHAEGGAPVDSLADRLRKIFKRIFH